MYDITFSLFIPQIAHYQTHLSFWIENTGHLL